MYNFAITGATTGIGKAIFDHVVSLGYSATNFSRTTDCDLSTSSGLIKLNLNIQNGPFNVFVNNAYVEENNVRILYGIANHWKDKPENIIINLGSMASEGIRHWHNNYTTWKKAADTAVLQLQHSEDIKCKIINIRPGYVDTPRVDYVNKIKINKEKVVEIIMWAINQSKDVYVREIKFSPLSE